MSADGRRTHSVDCLLCAHCGKCEHESRWPVCASKWEADKRPLCEWCRRLLAARAGVLAERERWLDQQADPTLLFVIPPSGQRVHTPDCRSITSTVDWADYWLASSEDPNGAPRYPTLIDRPEAERRLGQPSCKRCRHCSPDVIEVKLPPPAWRMKSNLGWPVGNGRCE